MEFDKSRVYTALNADELRAGDKVIVADSIGYIKDCLKEDDYEVTELTDILGEFEQERFGIGEVVRYFSLAYLVERKENCTNCAFNITPECDKSEWKEEAVKVFKCGEYMPKTEMPELIPLGNGQYAEGKHYRPFKDVDELVKVWTEKGGKWQKRELTMPYIWVQDKDNDVGKAQHLVTDFNVTILNEDNDGYDVGITVNCVDMTLEDLFEHFEFLDGSPCGVEE